MLFPPTVSVPLPRMTLPPVVPPPVREPIWVLKPARFKLAVAMLAMVTAELLPKAPLTLATETTPAVSVPALTVVAPV